MMSYRDSLELAVKAYGSTLSYKNVVEAAEAFFLYANKGQEIAAKPISPLPGESTGGGGVIVTSTNDSASAHPLQDYLNELHDKASAFSQQRDAELTTAADLAAELASELASKSSGSEVKFKVGDKVRWNDSKTNWEIMAKLDSEKLAWIKSSTSNDYRTAPFSHLKKKAD